MPSSPTSAIARLEFSIGPSEFDLAADRLGFVGPQVLRPRVVGRDRGSLGVVPVESLLSEIETRRVPGSGYARTGFQFTPLDYRCEEHGAEVPLDDSEVAMYRDLVDAEAVAAQRAIDAVLRKFEREVASKVFDTATWTGASLSHNVTNEWDDAANATPIADVDTARSMVLDNCGMAPDVLIISQKSFYALRNADQITDRLTYWAGQGDEPRAVTPQSLAAVFGLRKVLVASGVYNAANEGQAASLTDIWSSEYGMLCRVAQGDDPGEPCIGRTMLWSGDGPTHYSETEIAVLLESYRAENVRADIWRARANWATVIVNPAAGVLLTNLAT